MQKGWHQAGVSDAKCRNSDAWCQQRIYLLTPPENFLLAPYIYELKQLNYYPFTASSHVTLITRMADYKSSCPVAFAPRCIRHNAFLASLTCLLSKLECYCTSVDEIQWHTWSLVWHNKIILWCFLYCNSQLETIIYKFSTYSIMLWHFNIGDTGQWCNDAMMHSCLS